MNLLQRVLAYANGMATLIEWTVTGRVVDKDTAQARADICTGRLSGFPCPLNKPDLKLTEEVSTAFREHLALKNNLSLRVEGEKQLNTCSACLCPLRTKIWLEYSLIAPSEDDRKNFAVNCWLLQKPKP